MARQADSKDWHMQPARDFHVHHRQRNRDAGTALQNLVQATIQRIEKIGLVAVETQLAKKVTAGFFDEIPSIVEVAETVPQRSRKIVQAVQKRLRLKVREVDTGQVQSRTIHTDLGAFLSQDLEQMIHLPLLYPAR